MKKAAFYLISAIILTALCQSCSPDFYCRKCPVKDSTYIHVIEKDSMVPRDSVVLVPRDSFTIYIDSVPCKDFEGGGFDDKGNKVKIKVKDNKASIECECAEFKARIEWMERHHKKLIYNHRTLTKIITMGVRPSWWTYYQTWVMILVLSAIVTLKILKLVYKWPIPFL